MKKSGKTLRKSGKSQGKIREFEGMKKVGTLSKAMLDLSFDRRQSSNIFIDVCIIFEFPYQSCR